MIKNLNNKIKFFITIFLIFFSFFVFATKTNAFTEVYLEKQINEVRKGDIFDVGLKISSKESINVVDGIITYDKDILEIKDIKKDDKIFSLWPKEPLFEKGNGEIVFIAGAPGGFTGKDAQIFNITFLVKKEGYTTIGFKDIFSVFLNDGNGTNINPWLKPMSIRILEKQDTISKKIADNILNVNKNYKYLIGIFILIFLYIIIRIFFRIKK